MKYIVFGGAGFVGRYLVKSLCDQGEDVIVCDLVEPKNEFGGGADSYM